MILFATFNSTDSESRAKVAFENKFGLSASEYPMTFKLLSRAYKYVKSEKGKTMTAYNLSKQLQFFDAAVKEVLRKNKNEDGVPLINFVSKTTDFTAIAMNIATKKLSYLSDEDAYDCLLSAFQEVFLGKINTYLRVFDGTLPDGSTITIEGVIKMVLTQAAIRASKKVTEDFKKKQTINPLEDETFDDAFDRAVEKKLNKYTNDEEVLWDQILKDINKKFDKEFARSPNPDRASKVLEMLLMGYSKAEIADKFGLSNTRVGDILIKMKKAVYELAEEYDKRGDSTLLMELKNNFDKR